MTCVAIALTPDLAYVFADTASIGATGRLVKSASKIMTFRAARMVAVARGSIGSARQLEKTLAEFESFAAARAGVAERLRDRAGWLSRLAGGVELYVAGIDASERPAAFLIVSHAKHAGVSPWAVVDIDAAAATGSSPDVDPASDPVRFGFEAAQLQRAALQRLPFASMPVSIVGGALELAVVGADGIGSTVLGGWSDQVGELLNPLARLSDGSAVRPARRAPRPWLATRRRRFVVGFLGVFAAFACARLAVMSPALVYVERTYHAAPETAVETRFGTWTIWARPDLGKLLTGVTTGRELAGEWIGGIATSADHDDAARAWLAANQPRCMLGQSAEILTGEFEHEMRCE